MTLPVDELMSCPDTREKLELIRANPGVHVGNSGHAILPPSSAHRWVECPGSVQAEQQYPDTESDSSKEGTAAHWVAEQVLQPYVRHDERIVLAQDLEGQTAPNGVLITEEITDGVNAYVTDVLKACNDNGLLQSLNIEQKVSIDRVHPDNWGTPDADLYDAENGKIIVWDLKFGRTPVENRENWQLIEYAIGVLDRVTGGNGLKDQHLQVEMRIVQPRAFHVEGVCRGWTVTGDDLLAYANRLSNAASEALGDNPTCKTGEWCKYCTAARGCSTLQKSCAAIADRVESLNLHNLTPEHASVELRYLRQAKILLKQRLEALEVQALADIKKGVVYPGFGRGFGRGSFNWDKPDNEVIALGDLVGVDLRKKESPITPTQALKLKVDEAVINSYATKYQGSEKLVTDDKTIAGRVFNN